MTLKEHFWWVIAILGIATVVRLPFTLIAVDNALEAGTVYQTRMANNPDANEYLRLAENIAEEGAYSTNVEAPFAVELKRVPGYPILLAFLYAISGMQHNAVVILAANMGFSLLNIYLMMVIANHLFKVRIALLTGFIYALAPTTAVMGAQAMTEIFFTTWLLLSVYILLQITYDKIWHVVGWAILLGVCIAIASYVRAIAFYTLPIMLVCLALQYRPHRYWVLTSCVSMSVFAIAVFPWFAFNHTHFGSWTFSTVSSGNLLTYNAASVYAYRENTGLRNAKDQMNTFLGDALADMPEETITDAIFNDVRRSVAIDVLLDNIALTVWVHILDSTQLLRPGYSLMNTVLMEYPERYGNNVGTGSLPNPNNLTTTQLLLFSFMTLYYGFLYLLTAIGAISLLWDNRRWFLLALLGGLPYWYAFAPSIAGNSRFRVPIEGFMALLSAIACLSIYSLVVAQRANSDDSKAEKSRV